MFYYFRLFLIKNKKKPMVQIRFETVKIRIDSI